VKGDLQMVFSSAASVRVLVQTQWQSTPAALFEFYDVSCVHFDAELEHEPSSIVTNGRHKFVLLQCEIEAKEVLILPLSDGALGAKGEWVELRKSLRPGTGAEVDG